MPRLVLVVPGLLQTTMLDRLAESPSLQRLASCASLHRFVLESEQDLEESSFGLQPSDPHLAAGPLMVAALGHEPPPLSVHYCLTAMNFTDGTAQKLNYKITAAEWSELWLAATRLNSRLVTLLRGDGSENALVIETSSPEVSCNTPEEADNKPLKTILPEGVPEQILRQLIDDSVNLLSSLDFNKRREDEGLPIVNLLWPWGPGFRPVLTNLLTRRLEPCLVQSNSWNLAGLASLVGYRHSKRDAVGAGVNVQFDAAWERAKTSPANILFFKDFQSFLLQGGHDEAQFLFDRIDKLLLANLAAEPSSHSTQLLLISTDASKSGLVLRSDSRRETGNVYPFDERSISERAIPKIDLWSFVDDFLSPALRLQ